MSASATPVHDLPTLHATSRATITIDEAAQVLDVDAAR